MCGYCVKQIPAISSIYTKDMFLWFLSAAAVKKVKIAICTVLIHTIVRQGLIWI